jgi:microcystin-dependent protein
MAEPFLSEIRMMSFGFPPKGWALCNGQLLPINQNQALFSLLGTTFGGDGRVNFALPDLRGRTPIHVGASHTLGERGGEQAHTISISQMPTHLHQILSSATNANTNVATNNYPAAALNAYGAATALTSLNASQTTNTGGSQPHENMQPYLTINFSIALQGIFPSPT